MHGRRVIAYILAVTASACANAPDAATATDEQFTFGCRPDGTQRAVLTINDWQADESLVQSTRCRRSVDLNSPEWYVEIQLEGEGASMLERLTRASIGKEISIGVDGQERSTTKVQTPITGGKIRIFDNLSEADACTLAARLTPACEEG